MAAVLQDTLIHCITGEKEEASPIVIENKIKELETEFDRLLVLAVDENDIIDYKAETNQRNHSQIETAEKANRMCRRAFRSNGIQS